MINKIFTRNAKRNLILLGSMFIMLLSFQNCAKGQYQFEDTMVSEKMDYFEYHYTAASPLYYDVVMVSQADASTKWYTFFVFGATSDGTVSNIEYEIRAYNASHQQVCTSASYAGTIASTESSVEIDCTEVKAAKIYSIELKIKKSTDGAWTIYEKKYGAGI